MQCFWAIGTFAEVLLALWIMPTLGWRWLLFFSSVPLLIFVLSCIWLPESARYLVASGRMAEAEEVLRRVAAENGKPMLLGKLVDSAGAAEAKRGRIVDLFAPEMRQTTILLWFIWLANAFSYYGIVLFTTKVSHPFSLPAFSTKTLVVFELYESGDTCHGGNPETHGNASPACPLECVALTHEDYVDLLWTTMSEFPGMPHSSLNPAPPRPVRIDVALFKASL